MAVAQFLAHPYVQKILPVLGIPNTSCLAAVAEPPAPENATTRQKLEAVAGNFFINTFFQAANAGLNGYNLLVSKAPYLQIDNFAADTLTLYQIYRIGLAYASVHRSLPVRLMGACLRVSGEYIVLERHKEKLGIKTWPITERTWFELGRAFIEAVEGGQIFVFLDVVVTATRLQKLINL